MPPFKIEWDAPEFEERQKTVSWYWITIILAVLVLAFSIWEQNFLFGIFVIIAEVLFIAWGNRTPNRVHFVMNEKGLTVPGATFYPYHEFETFSVDESDEESAWGSLFFRLKRRARLTLRVYIPKERIKEAAQALRLGVREVEHEESLTDALERFFKF